MNEYKRWIKNAPDLRGELLGMTDAEIEDAFYRNLEFGTEGLRGILGPGTNRMNGYTVAKASQGLANYVKKHFREQPKIAIAYDSRIGSDMFGRIAAGVFAANGIKVLMYPLLMPTPLLSFAVRYFGCSAGIVITASHNPARYNGYKVYGPDGCQITTNAAKEIQEEIDRLNLFADVKRREFRIGNGVHFIPNSCYSGYLEEVKKQSVLFGDDIDRNIKIVYTPLNGAGLKPVTRILRESGFQNIIVVKEQKKPNGKFPTCPCPNPEIREALALGLSYAQKSGADLLLATDPDADRVGIAVRNGDRMQLLTGNEVGLLLLDFICSQRIKHGKMPDNPVLVKTIVTTNLAESIAQKFGVETMNVLTGFKYIGEQIGLLEKKGEVNRFLFGFEESYGYLSGTYVRDKDAVNGVFLVCEMFAYYKTRGIGLCQKLDELYREFGYCLNTLHSYEFGGAEGFRLMQRIMRDFRKNTDTIFGYKIKEIRDYADGLGGLPKSDVIQFMLEGNCSFVVRPSGTEPKIKVYLSVRAKDKTGAEQTERELTNKMEMYLREQGNL